MKNEREVYSMATSTFGKQFKVTPSKASEFVREMTKASVPTLKRDFHSNLAHLSQDSDLRLNLKEVLGKSNK